MYADDGFILNGQGLSLSNATPRDVTTTEASTVLTLTPGAIYNFGLTYLNYSAATKNALQLLWRKGGGALELVPREAIHARGRRDLYAFGGAVVAMKDGVMNAAPRTLSYLHGGHLGSVSLTTNARGQKVSEQPFDFAQGRQRAGTYGTVFMSAHVRPTRFGHFASGPGSFRYCPRQPAYNPATVNRVAFERRARRRPRPGIASLRVRRRV